MIIVRAILFFRVFPVLTVVLGFDLRPFLYPSRFPYQFKRIDREIEDIEKREAEKKAKL